jgi:hypothetical protein
MATLEDVRQALDAMSDVEFERFQKATALFWNRDELVRLYWHNSKDVEGLERYLGLPTEEEKVQQATIEAAKATVDAAESARKSAFWSKIAAIISFLALIVSIISIGISIQVAIPK